MIRKLFRKIWKYKWIYLLIFCISFVSDDSYWAATSGNQILSMCRYAFAALLPVVLVVFFHVTLSKKTADLVIVISFLLFVVSLLSGSGLGGPIMLVFTIVAAAMVATKIQVNILAERFCDVIILLILYSFAIQMMLLTGVIQGRLGENVGNSTLTIYGGCIYFNSYFGLIQRNSCFFREPGVFMVYICVAYLLDIWTNNKGLNLRRQLVFFIGILSTMSTAGIIIWGVLFMTNVLCRKVISTRSILAIAAIGVLVFFIFQNEVIYGNFFAKLDRGTESASVLGRLSSVSIPLKMTFDSPIWGCGTEKFREFYMRCGEELFHETIDPQSMATNSILNASAVFGLWYGIFLIFGLYNFSKRMARRSLIGVLFTFVSLLMIFSNESMQYSLILYVLIFYGLSNVSSKCVVSTQVNTSLN